jgi:copper chaperone
VEATTIKVTGMTCQGCVRSVTRVLEALPGVDAVEVSLERGEAAVNYDPARTGAPAFRKAVEDAGYGAA